MNPPHPKVRWGVLGYARIARESVIPAIRRSSNSEFALIASRDEAKLADCRTKFPGCRTCRSYEEVLADSGVDAVYIPLPNSMHREWTIKAAERGKHVLCEKPIALNAAQCREMIAACSSNGVKLMEAFMYRYTDRTRAVMEVVRGGALGEIRFIQASFRFLLANPASIKLVPDLGGGSLYDVGCYPVNFAGMIADAGVGKAGAARPESVVAQCVRRNGIDEILSALLRYPSGLIAALHGGFNAEKRVWAEVVGTRSVLEVPEPFFDNPGSLALVTASGRTEIPVAESDRYRGEVEDFAGAILGAREPGLPLAETLRNSEVIDQIYAAAR